MEAENINNLDEDSLMKEELPNYSNQQLKQQQQNHPNRPQQYDEQSFFRPIKLLDKSKIINNLLKNSIFKDNYKNLEVIDQQLKKIVSSSIAIPNIKIPVNILMLPPENQSQVKKLKTQFEEIQRENEKVKSKVQYLQGIKENLQFQIKIYEQASKDEHKETTIENKNISKFIQQQLLDINNIKQKLSNNISSSSQQVITQIFQGLENISKSIEEETKNLQNDISVLESSKNKYSEDISVQVKRSQKNLKTNEINLYRHKIQNEQQYINELKGYILKIDNAMQKI